MKTIIMFVATASLVAAGCSMFSSHDSELRELVFNGSIDSDRGIFTIDLDGTGLEKILISDVETHRFVSMSPDRERLIFSSTQGANRGEPVLYIVSPDGSNMRPLSTVMNSSASIDGLYPRWSTDSVLVFIDSFKYGYVADLTAGTIRRLDIGQVGGVEPGPVGMYAFLQDEGEPGYEVFTYREEGDINQLTMSGGSVAFGLDWSPDRSQIVFLERATDIVVIDTLGIEQSRHVLVPDSLQQFILILGDIEWLPDGQTVLANRRDSRIEKDTRYSLVAIDLSNNSLRTIVSGRHRFDATWSGGF